MEFFFHRRASTVPSLQMKRNNRVVKLYIVIHTYSSSHISIRRERALLYIFLPDFIDPFDHLTRSLYFSLLSSNNFFSHAHAALRNTIAGSHAHAKPIKHLSGFITQGCSSRVYIPVTWKSFAANFINIFYASAAVRVYTHTNNTWWKFSSL